MNLLQAILRHEVAPALGCTEPISCAYAAGIAAKALGETPQRMTLRVDRGTFKNGAAVTVPNSGGAKGNRIAAALGALIAKPEAKLEILAHADASILEPAKALSEKTDYSAILDARDFRVEVTAWSAEHRVRCVLAEGHTRVAKLEKDGRAIPHGEPDGELDGEPDGAASAQNISSDDDYREVLKGLTVVDAIRRCLDEMDDATRDYIARGIEMNLAMSEKGKTLQRTAYQIEKMHEKGILAKDVFYTVKTTVARAVDGRMAGIDAPVMTSGGSGNQGIVAILTPTLIGRAMKIPEGRILESIVAAHVINAYIKCYMGELAVVCGCAIAAGVAASLAIVYQQRGLDAECMQMAANNVVGDLSGLICDGAKPGCAMKTVTSVDSAVRSALMAIDGYALDPEEGVIGLTLESTIANLGKLALEGMVAVDPTVLEILEQKAGNFGRA